MRAKHADTTFKKGDRVRVTKEAIRRIRSIGRGIATPLNKNMGKIGRVVRSNPTVVRFTKDLEVLFHPNNLEKA